MDRFAEKLDKTHSHSDSSEHLVNPEEHEIIDEDVSYTDTELDKHARGTAVLSVVLAVLLLLPTLHNMYEVNYVHAADGPHEMMIYVQTTTDVDIVMARISELDQKLDRGQHQLAIGVMPQAGWPFYWYLRDYTNVAITFRLVAL